MRHWHAVLRLRKCAERVAFGILLSGWPDANSRAEGQVPLPAARHRWRAVLSVELLRVPIVSALWNRMLQAQHPWLSAQVREGPGFAWVLLRATGSIPRGAVAGWMLYSW
mmetsp:Transcript_13636/g.37887  ORF Transcript_13636/g.37887 Transcript_13636/m.37887 type:complete len:110 (+) Transcript_13636:224-553(+)